MPLSATLSLVFAGYFLNGPRAADANSYNSVFVAGQAVSNRIRSASTYSPASVDDVVTKPLAFKAMLTAAQQQTLEQTYTTTLARRWSNLPCGSDCRNGIQLGTLTAEQLAAALEVVTAAMGTSANEGSDEFNQIRLADGYLGADGGGSGYSAGICFLAFLITPSTTGAWMLQLGGHHYGANIASNRGHVVGATPMFEPWSH